MIHKSSVSSLVPIEQSLLQRLQASVHAKIAPRVALSVRIERTIARDVIPSLMCFIGLHVCLEGAPKGTDGLVTRGMYALRNAKTAGTGTNTMISGSAN